MDKENNSKTIYLDNAATTFPKPESVYTEMDYVTEILQLIREEALIVWQEKQRK